MNKNLISFLAAPLLLTSAGTLQATSVPTSGVYDSVNNVNQVDRNASGHSLNSTQINDIAGFTPAVLIAYNANSGGVITFDSMTMPLNMTAPILAKFGADGSKQIRITSSRPFNFQTSSNLSIISGENVFLNSRAYHGSFTLSFGDISDSAENPKVIPDEKVLHVGFTITGRLNGTDSIPVVTANFSDSTTEIFSSTTFTSDATYTKQDTFFAFSAPNGTYIQSIDIHFGDDNGADSRRSIDDFAIITGTVAKHSLNQTVRGFNTPAGALSLNQQSN